MPLSLFHGTFVPRSRHPQETANLTDHEGYAARMTVNALTRQLIVKSRVIIVQNIHLRQLFLVRTGDGEAEGGAGEAGARGWERGAGVTVARLVLSKHHPY